MKSLCMLSFVLVVFVSTVFGNITTKSAMDSTNHFSFEILKKKLSENAGENIVHSSFSIARALSMIYVGAEGETKSQIASTLGWDKNEDLSLRVLNENMKILQTSETAKIAEHIWAEKTFKILDSYSNIIGNVESASFVKHANEERTKINKWIENHTDNEIKNFFPDDSINELTKLVLVNAILFKGLWKKPFEKEYTRQDVFHCENGEKPKVEFMFQNGRLRSVEEADFQMVEIPYESDEFSFIATLPREGLSIVDFVNQLKSAENLYKKFGELRKVRGIDIDVFLPKFKVIEKIDLKQMLPAMGIKDMFLENKADFSRMTGDKSLFCSSAFHQASVEVNEEGTKASAATGFGMANMSLPPRIRLDRPFMFHIVHNKSNMVLFSGVVKKFDS